MLRSMMQVYVKDSCAAVAFYEKAFNAKLLKEYKHDDGTYIHAELDVYGQVLALSEANEDVVKGNTMQFCFQFEPSNIKCVEQAYGVLKEHAEIAHPLGESFYSKCMFALTDQYGIYWCLFV